MNVKKALKNNTNKKRDGLTLIEVIVSLALFAIVVVAMCSVLMTAFAIMGKSMKKQVNGMAAAGGLERQNGASSSSGSSGVGQSRGSLTVDFGGTQVTVSGSYNQASSGTTSGGVAYWDFTPDE